MTNLIACPIATSAQVDPQRVALIGPGWTLTYAELNAHVEGVARFLQDAGFALGSRIALYAPNQWRYVVAVLGILRAEMVACPVSIRWPMQRVWDALADIQAAALLTDSSGESWETLPNYTLEKVVQATAAMSETKPFTVEQDATIVFTSGSSGKPKAALHTVGNHYYSARGARANMPLDPDDRWLLSLPLYHVGGLAIVFRCLWAGATMVLPQSNMLLGHVLQANTITHVSLVATQLLRLFREAPAALQNLKAMLLGGSAIPATLLTEAYKQGLPIHTTYGLTEMGSQVTTTPPHASRAHLGTSGCTLPHRQLRIAADGEIEVNGPVRFKGYVMGTTLNQPFDADGWFATRDVGHLDADGYLHVTGRKDNQFISGGENIQPETIEHALAQVPDVVRAVVVPVHDAEFGQRPVAFVQTNAPRLDAISLRQALEQTLPRFMIPVAFYAWPQAENEAMKISRGLFEQEAQRSYSLQDQKRTS